MELEIGDIVICTVERIEGTTVFVKISWENREIEGSISTSEIAPGRIRNIRDYVVPKKRIVCKILRISSQGNIELSLRRVTQKDRKEILEKDKQEKSYIRILKSILGEKAGDIISRITKEESLYSFMQESKKNPKKLEDIFGKKNSEKLLEIINSQKSKKISVKKEISLTTIKPEGVELIKSILIKHKEAEIKYISGGKYTLSIELPDVKLAEHKLREILADIEKEARAKELNFSVKSK